MALNHGEGIINPARNSTIFLSINGKLTIEVTTLVAGHCMVVSRYAGYLTLFDLHAILVVLTKIQYSKFAYLQAGKKKLR